MTKYSFKKALVFTLLPVMTATLLGLVAGELYLRHFSRYGYVTPQVLKGKSLQYVPSLFSRYVLDRKAADVDGWNHHQYHINSRGYRGPEFAEQKAPGTIRIMFYGGSTVFDVAGDKDWPRRVEEILQKDGFKVEVLNAAVPGSATFDCFGRLFSEGHLFAPDYVVLYDNWNDFEYFHSNQPLLRLFQPYLPKRDPRLNYRNGLDKFVCEHSQLYVRARTRYYNWKYRVGLEGSQPQGKLGSEITDAALRQFRLNVEMFVDLAHEINAVPILMPEARLVSAQNTEDEKKTILYQYALLTHEALVRAFAQSDQILREVANEKNAFLIDSQKQMNGRHEFFLDHAHLNGKGSEQLAHTAAAELEEILAQKSKSPQTP